VNSKSGIFRLCEFEKREFFLLVPLFVTKSSDAIAQQGVKTQPKDPKGHLGAVVKLATAGLWPNLTKVNLG